MKLNLNSTNLTYPSARLRETRAPSRLGGSAGLIVWHATSPPVIKGAPYPTTAVFVTKRASATPFGNFHDRAVFRLINQRRVVLKSAKRIAHYGGRRFPWHPAP